MVNTVHVDTEEFKIKVRLHQGSALSTNLSVVVIDRLSEGIRGEEPLELLLLRLQQ